MYIYITASETSVFIKEILTSMANRKTVLNFCVYIWEPKYTIQGRSRNFFYVWSYSCKTFHSSVPSHTTFYIDSCGCDMRSTFDIILEYPTSKRSSFVWAEILFVLLTRPMVVRQGATRCKRLWWFSFQFQTISPVADIYFEDEMGLTLPLGSASVNAS